jgi:hypothetical protein
MDDLRLVGLSEDGTHLVLESADGARHALGLDERLHAAFRGDRARLGQLQIQIQGELRPREIQARIRGGESAAGIAAAAGIPVDRVARYEAPILLERAHTAELAQAVGVRRVTDSTSTPLGDLVRARLGAHGVDESTHVWDSWRRDDGRWLVQLTYEGAGATHVASWLFDPMRRTVEPADDEARWLTDEERAAPSRAPRRAPVRLAAVPAVQPEPEVGRYDTVPLVAAPPPAPAAGPEQGAVAERDDRPVELDPPVAEAVAGSHAVAEVDELDEAGADEEADELDETAGPAARARGSRSVPPPRRKGKGRATVPSWDEILFGAPRPHAD